MPIEFKPTLRETVSHNYPRLFQASVRGLVAVVKDYPEMAARAVPQGSGRKFTTPTYSQYRHMVRQHRQLYEARHAKIR
jgi:hypothetical protein